MDIGSLGFCVAIYTGLCINGSGDQQVARESGRFCLEYTQEHNVGRRSARSTTKRKLVILEGSSEAVPVLDPPR